MSTLSLNLQNCYGITIFSYDFDFNNKDARNRPIQKACAIYAPNDLMKTSFTNTENINNGNEVVIALILEQPDKIANSTKQAGLDLEGK